MTCGTLRILQTSKPHGIEEAFSFCSCHLLEGDFQIFLWNDAKLSVGLVVVGGSRFAGQGFGGVRTCERVLAEHGALATHEGKVRHLAELLTQGGKGECAWLCWLGAMQEKSLQFCIIYSFIGNLAVYNILKSLLIMGRGQSFLFLETTPVCDYIIIRLLVQ